MKLFLVLICSLVAFNLEAKEYKGVNFADEIKVGNTTLKLNGVGTRTAMSIISVYAGGLYVAAPTTDEKVIIESTTPKKIDMHFLMGLGKDKLKEGWDEGFFRNADKEYKYREELNTFYSYLENMKKGDRIQLTMYADKTEVQVKENPVQTIPGAAFSKTMVKVYINNIPDEGLKKGLLGLKNK